MCGIAGLVMPDPPERSAARVATMLGRLAHRGPDDEGIAFLAGACLGARRLSIIDLTGGHQPMANEDGTVIAVQNGEIYNFEELRQDLIGRGHVLRTRSDTEVLPHLYEEHGPAFVEKLRGMFAVAVWDSRRRRLVLARDPLGKKPLVYLHDAAGLRFASEIQALLALEDTSRAVDDEAIAEYLTYGYVPAPRTAFAAIRKVPPGSRLVLDEGNAPQIDRYWTPRFEPKLRLTQGEAEERLRAEIDEAVRLRLISDVPLGVLLSGGLDSSTVVAFMARHSDRPVKTFSVGFSEEGFDELRYARIVAKAYGTEHYEQIVRPDAVAVLPMLARHFGEPFADSSAIPTYYVAKMAREHVTVVLNGDGGDELFAGYDRYRAVRLASFVDRVPGLGGGADLFARATLGRLRGHRLPARVLRLAAALGTSPDERYFRWMGYFTGPRRAAVFGTRLRGLTCDPARALAAAASLGGAVDPVERAMATDLFSYLPGDLLAKMDIATMASSLEARAPFLDHRLVEFVSALPRSYKMSIGTSKVLLRSTMRGILPGEILARGKMGFGVPVGRWLRGPLREMLQDLVLSPSGHAADYLESGGVRAIVNDHLTKRSDHTSLVWSLLMLELWFRECVNASAPARPTASEAH